jgi:N-acetylglucosaminyldiphosphoundecaprenol N-acetyl-beta-D-mannosaminyltransferase
MTGMESTGSILGVRVHTDDYETVTERLLSLGSSRESSYVCVANVHMIMEAYDDRAFKDLVNGAVYVTPDGMPLVWGLRMLGHSGVRRVYGPDLVLHICKAAAIAGISIGLYGGTPESLYNFCERLKTEWPNISIACKIAPPFRSLTEAEDQAYTNEIRESGVEILFVGIGCPRQEIWMHAHVGKIPAVMIGVGAAFDFHSGRVRQAPSFLQKLGLEWLFRLSVEPKRLFRRYLRHNPRFVLYFAYELLRTKLSRGISAAIR